MIFGKGDEVGMGIGAISAVFAIIISIIVIMFNRRMNEKISRQNMNPLFEDDDKTVLMRDEEDEQTELMNSSEDEPTLMGRMVVLRSEKDGREYSVVC